MHDILAVTSDVFSDIDIVILVWTYQAGNHGAQ